MANARDENGHPDAIVSFHARRTADDSAAFLLPHLTADMALLDVGCGPGSITLDLASRVALAHGIDPKPEAITAAEEARSRTGASNVSFSRGDAYHLPFEEECFDVVFAHQVLQHLGDPVGALREMRRVLRPEGLLAVRDADYGTMVHAPHQPRLDEWLVTYVETARHAGGEPHAGRYLPTWVSEAGFADLMVTTSSTTHVESVEVEAWRDLWTSPQLVAGIGAAAESIGLGGTEHFEHLTDGWQAWAVSERPLLAFLNGEVIARR
jgi:ubiquinone/menaquinone biosynthesis C-methylase UbiE